MNGQQKMTLLEVQQNTGAYLDRIKAMFIPGSKIAVFVLPPGGVNGDRDFSLFDTNFSFEEMQQFLDRAKRVKQQPAIPPRNRPPHVPPADLPENLPVHKKAKPPAKKKGGGRGTRGKK